jgi:hypothetical protein
MASDEDKRNLDHAPSNRPHLSMCGKFHLFGQFPAEWPEATKRPSDTHKRTKQEHEARSARETKGFQPLPARWVSGTLTGHVTTPQTVGNSQPIVSFEYRVALVPAASAYVSNSDVSLVRASPAVSSSAMTRGTLLRMIPVYAAIVSSEGQAQPAASACRPMDAPAS